MDRKALKEILDNAAGIAPEARGSYLDAACAGDTALRAEVFSLLGAHDYAARFMTNPTAGPNYGAVDPACATAATVAAEVGDPVAANVGPYRLLERIGEGGFGTVYMAEQSEPVRRRVALKIIKAGMDTQQVIARFEAERQALAMMEHPNIARVLDAGTTEAVICGADLEPAVTASRPYIVMELIRGIPITRFCNEQRLPLRERLALFGDVCHAVQHAHQKGVIHRDLKPSNVLVSRHDDTPVVKVIDFGVAKATAVSGPLTDKTLFTEFRQMIGTPAYMSPEQAAGSLDIDTRSDIYSLGVLLYELLTCTTPFDAARLRSVDYDELRRIIREEEPPKPSARVSSLRHQSLDPSFPHSLIGTLRGDLDWITLKCLEKDRSRRYPSAHDLAADIERHLRDEPVAAGAPSRLYRLRKALRRHRTALAIGSTFAVLLVSGAMIATVSWQRAEGEAENARQQRDKAHIIARFMEETLRGVDPAVARGRDVTLLRELMDASAQRIRDGELAAAPEAELRLRLTIGIVYTEIAQYASAHEMLDPTERMSASLHGTEHEGTIDVLNALAGLAHQESRWADARRLSQAAFGLCQRLDLAHAPAARQALHVLAFAMTDLGQGRDALPIAESALALQQRLNQRDHWFTAEALSLVGILLECHGRPADALAKFDEAAAMLQRLYGDHPAVINTLCSMAVCLKSLGRPADAIRTFRTALQVSSRVYGESHPQTVNCRADLAEALRSAGQLEEAELHARQAVQLARLHPEWGSIARAHPEWFLAHTLDDLGRPDEAVASLRAFLPLSRDDVLVHICAMDMLGWALLRLNELEAAREAERVLRESMAVSKAAAAVDGMPAWLHWQSMSQLGESLVAQSRFGEAEPLLVAAYRALRAEDSSMGTPQRVGIDFRRESLVRVVKLYDAWNAAEPDAGHDVQAARWRQQLQSEQPDASQRAPAGPWP